MIIQVINGISSEYFVMISSSLAYSSLNLPQHTHWFGRVVEEMSERIFRCVFFDALKWKEREKKISPRLDIYLYSIKAGYCVI